MSNNYKIFIYINVLKGRRAPNIFLFYFYISLNIIYEINILTIFSVHCQLLMTKPAIIILQSPISEIYE